MLLDSWPKFDRTTVDGPRTYSRRSTLFAVFGFWAAYALLLVGSGMLFGMMPRSLKETLRATPLMVFGPIVSLGAFALTAFMVRRDQLRLTEVGAAPDHRSAQKFVIGLSVGVVLVVLNLSIHAIAGARWTWAPQVGAPAALLTICAFFAGAIGEELGFRGYPLHRLHRVFSLWTAQAIVALSFAVYHVWVGVPWRVALITTGTGSVLFGMAAMASRGLAVPIGMHTAWNIGQWMIGLNGSPGLWTVSPNQRVRTTFGTVIYLVVAVFGILAFWLWHRYRLQRPNITTAGS